MKRSAKSKALVLARMKENDKSAKHAGLSHRKGPWDKRSRKADGGAVDDWVTPPADDWVTPPPPKAESSLSSYLPAAISDIPSEIVKAASENLGAIKTAFVPGGQGQRGQLENLANMGRGIAAIPGLVASPITGAARSLIGHPMAQAEHKVGEIIAPEIAAKDDPQKMYEAAKGDVDLAMSAIGARGGLKPAPAGPPPIPPQDPLGVTLSEGQRTGELPAIRTEQAALRGQLGSEAEARAKAFAEQQDQQLAQARGEVAKSLDAGSQVIAESPREAAELAAQTVQKEAGRAKQGVTQAYDEAKALPGEIHADAFRDMGDTIKTDLSNRPDPVIIDDKLTPMASHMIRDIDDRVTKLQIQNRAQPPSRAMAGAGEEEPKIVGVTLQDVDQVRKRLSTFRKDAYASGNATDGRAAQAVLDAFDARIDNAVNSGLFTGDPAAVNAWNAARAAHADYMRTFGKGKNDPVGRVVEKILGTKNNPAAIPNDVADFMYGATGTNPSSLNVGVAKRIKGILGEDSPEWSGVRQGLFERAVGEFGHDKAVKNLDKLLNADGKELSEVVFTPAQRQLLQKYADLREKLKIPASGVNRSETSTFVAPMMKKLTSGVAAVIGAVLGHTIAPGAYGLGELIGAGLIGKGSGMISDAAKARKIANQMPLVANRLKQYQKALAAYQRSSKPLPAGLSIAASDLAKALGNIGFDYNKTLRLLQGPVPTSAEDEKKRP